MLGEFLGWIGLRRLGIAPPVSQKVLTAESDGTIGTVDPASIGVTDHGALTGLSDDDHTQYHNDARGDARYYTQSQIDSALTGKEDAGTAAAAVSAHVAASDPHPQYLTAAEGAAAFDALGAAAAAEAAATADLSAHIAAADPHPQYLTAAEGDAAYDTLGAAAAAQAAAEATASTALGTHEADTTSVHGIADTSALLDSGDIGSTVHAHMDSASQAEMEAGTEAGLRAMSPLRVAQAIAALGGGSELNRAITFGSVGNAADGTIVVCGFAPFAGTINSLKALQTASGTITATVKINGVNVTGLASLSGTSTPQSPNASGSNTFSIGDSITVVLSSNSSAVDLQGTLNITPS